MTYVDAAGRQKVGHADRRHRVHADDFLLCRHGVHHDAIYTGGKTALRIISAGFLVSAVSVTACGALEGLGKGTPSLIISLCRFATRRRTAAHTA